MQTTKNTGLPKILRYLFLCLTCFGAIWWLLNLSAYIRVGDNGATIRGWVTTVGDSQHTVVPHPDGSGDLKMYNFGERKFVMLEFSEMQGMLKLRYLGYMLLENLKYILVVFGLYQMYLIFRNLDLGLIFRDEQIRRIRLIAVAVLVFPIANQIASRIIAGVTYEAEGHRITTAIPPLLSEQIVLGGLLALMLFALAEVFRSGAILQQEQDLTI
ncbi:MAG: DUF2975 domain-containing protein [Lewinellaceae bacterium]|nr:DUF2975 domain-containing protein [Lewinellaceae bacterium]